MMNVREAGRKSRTEGATCPGPTALAAPGPLQSIADHCASLHVAAVLRVRTSRQLRATGAGTFILLYFNSLNASRRLQ